MKWTSAHPSQSLRTTAIIHSGEPSNPPHEPPAPADGQPLRHPTESARRGYIQSINTASLIDIATKLQATIRTPLPIGSFVVPGQTIASIATDPGHRPKPSNESAAPSSSTATAPSSRTPSTASSTSQTSPSARSLPGINDTNTATMCVDQLSAKLDDLAESVERSIDSKSDIARLDRRIEKARQSLR